MPSSDVISRRPASPSESISTPACARVPPHQHLHDYHRHLHLQQQHAPQYGYPNGPGLAAPRAGDWREAWGDRDGNANGNREGGGKNDEELAALEPICDDGECVSVYIATAHRSRPTPTRFIGFCTPRWVLHRELSATHIDTIHLACLTERTRAPSAPASSFVLFPLLRREHFLLIPPRSPSASVRDDWQAVAVLSIPIPSTVHSPTHAPTSWFSEVAPSSPSVIELTFGVRLIASCSLSPVCG
ncbi:hypothetical protein B0H13DRAFT_2525742 [Mycena leptocephala]|nr:hypothetical protein B0H13DRAFT_2525742 [Mycena leptocephala]